MFSDLEINCNWMYKLSDIQLDALDTQIKSIDEQIEVLQKSKEKTFKTFWVSKQAYYYRLRVRDKKK